MRRLVPFAHVSDVARSIAFYEQLGFSVGSTFEEGGELHSAYLSRNAAELMPARASKRVDPDSQTVLFYQYVDDVEAYHGELAQKRHRG